MVLGRCPTDTTVRDLCKACPAIGQLAFLRVVARLRTDSSHERTLLPLRGCALLRLQSTLRLGFWTFSLSTNSSELNSFLLIMRIAAPESTTNYRFWFLRSDRRRHTFDFTKTLELVNIFRSISHCFAGASFLGQRLLM